MITPKYLMDALTFEGGVRNTVTDFIKLKRDNEVPRDYVTALEAGLIGRLGSPTEILYEQRADGELLITSFPYSNCYYTKYVMDGVECMWDDGFVYRNVIGKEELSEDEIRYQDVHGKKKKRSLPGPFPATFKKNKREKYRKLKESFAAARRAGIKLFNEGFERRGCTMYPRGGT